MNWYLKKEYFDIADDIEAVSIHYTWTPLGKAPDWSAHRESRLMPAGEYLATGVGEVSKYGPAAPGRAGVAQPAPGAPRGSASTPSAWAQLR